METVLHFIIALIALGILVFIHELGHYIVAKWVKMKVEVFSIGFGRPILSWTRGDERWQIGWMPFGGYVKISGMEFGKDQNTQVEGGFFTKKPLDRLKVAIAGPLANLLLSLIIFSVIWIFNGREKPFSEFSKHIGYVDITSQAFKEGLRPGDLIDSYDSKAYNGIKDLFYSAMFNSNPIQLSGVKINEENYQKTPFSFDIAPYQMPKAPEGLKTYGILAPARYLIYDRFPSGEDNILPKGSPMEISGINLGDRIVWADGAVIYSQEQLSQIINESKSLLNIQRGSKKLFVRVPRVQLNELKLTIDQKGEISDWQYLAKVPGKISSLYFIPYNLTSDNIVEEALPYIDPEFKRTLYNEINSTSLDLSLLPGDKILAVDGIQVEHGADLLRSLQVRNVLLIAQRGGVAKPDLSWLDADKFFNTKDFIIDLQESVNLFAQDSTKKNYKNFVLLNPVSPKKIENFNLTEEQKLQLNEKLSEERKKIEEMSDIKKRSIALQSFEESKNKLMLGINFQDEMVNYNPNPWILFTNIFKETWQTLIALFSGSLSPKWLSGPVGIVQVMQHGLTIGLNEALFWVAAISINLGFLNLLPIPVLDGGYIVLCLVEMISGKKIKPKTMEKIILPFMILLIGFIIFVTYWDIIRLF
jgi:regulator of sigma E protease